MFGTVINTFTVIAGGGLGLIFKRGISEKYQTIYFQVVGLFTILLGVTMALPMAEPLFVIISLILGGFIGLGLKLETRVEQLGNRIKKRLKLKSERFSEGLITAFLLFCTGSMTILGAIEEGLGQPANLLLTKSILDFFSAIMLAAGLGIGVVFAAIPLFLFQGGITLLVAIVGKSIPIEIVSELTVVGGIILIGLGINLLKIKKLEIFNLLPSLILIGLFVWLKMVLC